MRKAVHSDHIAPHDSPVGCVSLRCARRFDCRNANFYRSHAPAWECSLYRSCGSIPPTLERRRMHSHAERSSLCTSRCGNPEGVQAISRGLSEATPPDGKPNKIATPEGLQSFLRGLGYHQPKPDICVISESAPRFLVRLLRPLRGRMWYLISTGGVASLNPRLIAGNPRGCN